VTDEDRLSQLSNDLNEVHTLVEIARRMIWAAEGDVESAEEPSGRMRRILQHLDEAHTQLDQVMDEVEAERGGQPPSGDHGPGPIIH
jgi:chromosome segregation ATPase